MENKTFTVVGLGELLWDLFPDKKQLGGAPANFSYMTHLLGDTGVRAKAKAETVMAIETALAKASLTRVEQREPHNLFHKLTAAQLAALTPSFNCKVEPSSVTVLPLRAITSPSRP